MLYHKVLKAVLHYYWDKVFTFFQSDFISIARSNDKAVNNRIRHVTVIPEKKQKGLLKVI